MGNNWGGDFDSPIEKYEDFIKRRSEEKDIFNEELNRFPNLICDLEIDESSFMKEMEEKKQNEEKKEESESSDEHIQKEVDPFLEENTKKEHIFCSCKLNLFTNIFSFVVSDCGKRLWKKEVKVSQMFCIKTRLDIGKKLKWKIFFGELIRSFRTGRMKILFKDLTEKKGARNIRKRICYLTIEVSKIPFIKQSEITLRLAPVENGISFTEIGNFFVSPLFEYYEHLQFDDSDRKVRELEKELGNLKKRLYRLSRDKRKQKKRDRLNGKKQRKKRVSSTTSNNKKGGKGKKKQGKGKGKRKKKGGKTTKNKETKGKREVNSGSIHDSRSGDIDTDEEDNDNKEKAKDKNKSSTSIVVKPSAKNEEESLSSSTTNENGEGEKKETKTFLDASGIMDPVSPSSFSSPSTPPSSSTFRHNRPRLMTQDSFSKSKNVMVAWGVTKYDQNISKAKNNQKGMFLVNRGDGKEKKFDIIDREQLNGAVNKIDELMVKLIRSGKMKDSEYNSFHSILFPLKKLIRINHLYPKRIQDETDQQKKRELTKYFINNIRNTIQDDGTLKVKRISKLAMKKNISNQDIERKLLESEKRDEKIEGGLQVNVWSKQTQKRNEDERMKRIMDFEKERHQTKEAEKAKLGEEEEEGEGNRSPKNIQLNAISQEKTRDSVMHLFRKVDEWNFDIFELEQRTGGDTLFYTGYALFIKYDFPKLFKIPDDVVISFLREIDDGYRANPYHNAMHASDVTQISHFIISKTHLGKKMTHLEKLGLIVSSLIHDYGHPGVNNKFNVETSSYLAILYNDRSVLENHHVAQAFELMKSREYNIFQNLGEDEYRVIRKWIIELVLATDMDNHHKYLNSFQEQVLENNEEDDDDDNDELLTRKGETEEKKRRRIEGLLNQYDKRLISAQMMIKFADVSNCSRPLELYLKWAVRIEVEFFNQGDKEKEKGIRVSPHMDRNKPELNRLQEGFINYVIVPTLELIVDAFPNLNFALKHVQMNKRYWKKFVTYTPENVKRFYQLEEIKNRKRAKKRKEQQQQHRKQKKN